MHSLRLARLKDVPAITAIYNDAVKKTTGTFDTDAKTLAQQKAWFRHHGPKHPVIVAEKGGQVLAWASLSPWSDRCAYARSVEISVYVSENARGKGLGGALMDDMLKRAKAAGARQMLARIAEGNAVSLKLHEKRGFIEVGRLRRVGEKFGKVLDVHILQASLEPA
jgi:phosphinothricin acetyltransferase